MEFLRMLVDVLPVMDVSHEAPVVQDIEVVLPQLVLVEAGLLVMQRQPGQVQDILREESKIIIPDVPVVLIPPLPDPEIVPLHKHRVQDVEM